MISCGCDRDSGIWSVNIKEVICRKERICPSCNLSIKENKTMYFYSMYDFDENKPSTSVFLCEECGDLAETLTNLGFCFNLLSVKDNWLEYLLETQPDNPAVRKYYNVKKPAIINKTN